MSYTEVSGLTKLATIVIAISTLIGCANAPINYQTANYQEIAAASALYEDGIPAHRLAILQNKSNAYALSL